MAALVLAFILIAILGTLAAIIIFVALLFGKHSRRTKLMVLGIGGLFLLLLVAGGVQSALSPRALTSDTEFEINVTGTPARAFSGSIMVVSSKGQTTSQSFDGKVPATYYVTGTMVSVAFQKKSPTGTLAVEIVNGGRVIKSGETTAEYGLVSVATTR